MGRPSKYSKELGQRICEQIIAGKSVRKICRESDEMPAASQVFSWLVRNPEFQEQYARARELQAEQMADELMDIADDGSNDTYETEDGEVRTNHDVIARSKLRVDTRKWVMSKLLPKKYGDRLTVNPTTNPDLDLGDIPIPTSSQSRTANKPN